MLSFTLYLSAVESKPPLQRWFYCSQNLLVDRNVDELETLIARAAKAGYTHVLLADSKFSKLGDMEPRYFRNIERVKTAAKGAGVQIVPALFSIGYSNDLLWHDPNLIEAMPVTNALFVVRGGEARLEPDPALALKGGDFSDLALWGWKDANVTGDSGTALIRDPNNQNARIVQQLKLTPFRQYHLSLRIRTADFLGTPEAKVIANGRVLNYNSLGAKRSQEWSTHHIVFNSLNHTEANLYLGTWGGRTGSLWFDDARLEEVGLLNIVRRPGAPLTVRDEQGRELQEGRDFESVKDPLMGNQPWHGAYDIWHLPPVIRTRLPNGTRLRVSYYHGVTVHDDQAMICPSEPRTMELLRDQAKRMHAAWGARGYMMSHDEIRVLNWCAACQKRNLDAGAILSDNVRTCIRILCETNPGGDIYVWSDMFDPHHNAVKDYYLVRGDLAGSWAGLDKDVIIVPWYFEKRNESLHWFAERGHRQVMAGYYDHEPARVRHWLSSAKDLPGVVGVMYTTWERKYSDLEEFSRFIADP